MTPLCQHLMPTGKTCQSPALSGQPLCFHHDREATQTAFILTLPALTDRSSILLALSQVVVAMGLNQIDTKRANLLLRSMNLANRLISALEKEAKTAQKAAAVAAKTEPKPKVEEPVAVVEEVAEAETEPVHRVFAPQYHPNDRQPRSMRDKLVAMRKANLAR